MTMRTIIKTKMLNGMPVIPEGYQFVDAKGNLCGGFSCIGYVDPKATEVIVAVECSDAAAVAMSKDAAVTNLDAATKDDAAVKTLKIAPAEWDRAVAFRDAEDKAVEAPVKDVEATK